MKAAVVKENYLDTLRAIDPELVKPPFPASASSSASLKTADKEIEAFVREIVG